jgi:hypothetical protein
VVHNVATKPRKRRGIIHGEVGLWDSPPGFQTQPFQFPAEEAQRLAELCGRTDEGAGDYLQKELSDIGGVLPMASYIVDSVTPEAVQRLRLERIGKAARRFCELYTALDYTTRDTISRYYWGDGSERQEALNEDIEVANRLRRAIDTAHQFVKPRPGPRSNEIRRVSLGLAELYKTFTGEKFRCVPFSHLPLPVPFKSRGARFVFEAGRIFYPAASPSQFLSVMRDFSKQFPALA